jgi:two-component system phosphate regulon sensor histidine kinase PhoR
MKKIWASESWAITSVIIFTLFLGTLSGFWYASLLLALLGYIGWIYYRLLKLEKWVSRGTKLSKVYDDHGFIGTIIRHLYQQKKTHSQRKKRTKDILGRLNRNISALPDATILLNEYREIEWCNEPAHYLFSIDMRNDVGQRITNLIRNPKFLEYLEAPEDRPYLEIESPGDHNVTVQIKLVRFGDDQSLLIARNVSDQKQLQEGLKNFVANASHELKSPLTVINGHLEMLEAESGLSDAGMQSLQTAQKQSERMRQLIEDLLLLSQVESYHLQPGEGERLDVGHLMENVVKALDIGENKGRIQSAVSAGLRLLGVKAEIEGVCFNLIENALKYSNPGSVVKVEWSSNDESEPIFKVIDQGPGITEQDLPNLTQRYFRGSHTTVDSVAGTGLGLSIVEQTAHKHGALLLVDSRPGVGSTFTIVFPSYRLLDRTDESTPVIRLADY